MRGPISIWYGKAPPPHEAFLPPQIKTDKTKNATPFPFLVATPRRRSPLWLRLHTGPNLGHMGRSFSDDSTSSSFSKCNSDRSGEFLPASSHSRRLLLACAASNGNAGNGDEESPSSLDDLIRQLVADLDGGSCSLEAQRQAALELRLLAKNQSENRLRIARAGAVRPLVALVSSSDLQLQEYSVTALLNLSLCDENKDLIARAGAAKPLVWALRTGTSTTRGNAACALLRLAQVDHHKGPIGRSGAIPALVDLLETGG